MDVVIDRIGNWYVVAVETPAVYDRKGGYDVYGSFRNINDALDLRRTLREALDGGRAVVERWEDPE